jgi:hypothetical protein
MEGIHMNDGERIAGPPSKPYELWRLDVNKQKYERLASADTFEELAKIKPSMDYQTAIYHKGRLVEKERRS